MTIIKENNAMSIYSLNQEQLEILEHWDRSNKNELKENELSIDHCVFEICDGLYLLIIHGSKTGEVMFNGKLLKVHELEKPFRQEQNLPDNKDIVIRFVCCYDGLVGHYLSNHCLIINSFNTEELVKYNFFKSKDNNIYSQFINLAYAI